MLHVPGFKFLLINRHVSALEAAASRERLAAEARTWRAADVLPEARPVSTVTMLRRLADRGGA